MIYMWERMRFAVTDVNNFLANLWPILYSYRSEKFFKFVDDIITLPCITFLLLSIVSSLENNCVFRFSV